MRKILALDLSVASTGWALGSPDGDPAFGHYALPSTGNDIGKLLAAFQDWLSLKIAGEDIALCVFEAPILSRGKTHVLTARKLMGLAGVTELICHRAAIRCVEEHLQTNKKRFAGHGHADKHTMMHVARRYGWDVTRDDEADALALWVGGVCTYAKAHAGRYLSGPLGARPFAGVA
ncbi:hypothetical protein [Methylobacterium nodulans]|uniref:Putative bacteriophage-related protein n=1 Tax=Methylobacterium nodulans (strain LMG 21967 / CNCM I-2342 / ORS 2060) TaxID=460265 RepID=B8IAN4_METNO|nr:hypothetical protein [Methylobacterium nodulans]ACL61079.1 putative bacteriophage-related protein [Methylobacterium nodulans ORS 2060]